MNHLYKQVLLLLIGACITSTSAWSQIVLSNGAMAGPDIESSAVICDKTRLRVPNFSGSGTSTTDECLGDLTNTVWISWIAQSSGPISFIIEPNNPNVNIDFVLYETVNPRELTVSDKELRCSTSSCPGETGLRTGAVSGETNKFTCNGTDSNGFLSPALQLEGSVYALLIHSTSDENGFKIDFGGEAEFAGPEPVINFTGGQCFGSPVTFFTQSFGLFEEADISTYEWNFGEGATPSNTATQTNQSPIVEYSTPGKKTVNLIVTTSLGCRISRTFEEFVDIAACCESDNKITVDTTLVKVVSCPSDADGAISIAVNSILEHSVLWESGETAEILTGLGPETYKVVATNAAQCKDSITIMLSAPDVLFATFITPIVTDCASTNGGMIKVVPTGGRAPYEYNYGIVQDFVAVDSIAGLSIGPHIITVRDETGCSFQDTVVIEPLRLEIELSDPKNAACKGDSTGSIQINELLGMAPYNYDFGDGLAGGDAILSALPAGDYVVTVTDANQCSSTVEVAIGEPNDPVFALIESDFVACFGANTASIIADPSGGTPIYNYEWSNGAETQMIENVIADTYTLTVTDANGCTFVESSTIFQPDSLQATLVSKADLQCFTDTPSNDGQIIIVAQGGTAPYEYSEDGIGFQEFPPDSDTLDLNKLAPGAYSISIRDAQGCILASPVETIIESPTQLIATDSTTLATCGGGRDGSIILSATGGLAPYQYDFATAIGIFETNSTGRVDTLAIGDYSAIITDANGCPAYIQGIEVAELVLEVDTLSIQNLGCFRDRSGAVALNVLNSSDAQVPYSYDIFDGRGLLGDSILTALSAGTYTIDVYDANNCQGTSPNFTITEPPSIVMNVEPIRLSCFGDTNGSTIAIATGGVGDFTYNWSNDATTRLINDLGAGIYTVTVTDENACTATASITAIPPAPITISNISSVDVDCPSDNSGAISLDIEGGVAPYQYSIDEGATFGDITMLSNLAAADYNIVIQDAEGCDTTITASVGSPSSVEVFVIGGECFGDIVSFSDFSSFAQGTIVSWNWDFGEGADIPIASGPGPHDVTFTLLGTPEVRLTVLTDLGCSVTKVVNGVDNPDSFTLAPCCGLNGIDLSTFVEDTRCADTEDGSIRLEALTPSTSPVIMTSWDNGDSTQTITNLGVGTYAVTVTNQATCTATTSATISSPDPLLLNTITIPPSCGGGMDGVITLVAEGGTGSYRYDFGNSIFIDDPQTNGYSAGTYDIIVVDEEDCRIRDTVILEERKVTIETTAIVNPFCNGGSDASIALNHDGMSPLTSILYNQTAVNAPPTGSGSSAMLTDLTAGNYAIEITDAEQCVGNIDVIITQPEAITLNLQGENISCFGETDGQLRSMTTGGTGAYEYIWRTPTDEIISTSATATGLAVGDYFITVTDANDCEMSETGLVVEPPELFALVGNVQDVFCFGQSNGAITIEGIGGSGGYSYSKDGILFQQNATLSDLGSGTYTVVVQDDSGCEAESNTSVAEPGEFTIVTGQDQEVDLGQEIQLQANVSSAAGVVYTWEAPDSLSCSNCPNPMVTPSRSAQYKVTATNPGNCTATATINVSVSFDRPVYIPNVFSPNGDGINDRFYVIGGPAVRSVRSFRIFDRFGALLFDQSNMAADDPTSGWDGRANGRILPSSVYVVRAEVEFIDNEVFTIVQNVTLIAK